MINNAIFREYDIRGIVDKDLDERSVKLIGYFLGKEILKIKNNPNVAIGYDARVHSTKLFKYLASGLIYSGCSVFDIGMVATGIAYFVNFNEIDGINFDASIMITGSHNPKEYNGFKITIDKKPFFGEDIYKLRDTILANLDIKISNFDKVKKVDAKTRYIDYIVSNFTHLKNLDKKIVFDCGNGVANTVLEDILDKLNIKHKIIYGEPDGNFPNHHPDPSEEKNLIDIKKELDSFADFGFAYDGDGDRIAFLTKKYNYKGDILAIFFAKNMTNPIVLGEVKCSQIMYDEINKIGKAYMYKTGHSNLKIKMNEIGANLACEVSGHIFFKDRYFGYDDAIYATMRLLELIKNSFDFEKEYEKLPKTYNTDEIKIKTTEDEKFKIIQSLKQKLSHPPANFPKIKDIITVDGVRVVFEDGWGLVRASNTTPVLVTRFEATNKEKLNLYQEKLLELIKE